MTGKKTEKCPNCMSKNNVWRGYRYNQKTIKRLKKCTKCGSKFTPDDGFFRMRFSPNEIKKAVSLYKKGYSSAEVVKHLSRRGIKVSRWTVITWHNKYRKLVKA